MADRGYIPRSVDLILDALTQELPAIMLTGPRACGKTTTALRRASSSLRLDRPEQAASFRSAPDAVLAAQTPPVLIDEWQVVPESLAAVKRAVDEGSGAGRFLVTGSVRSRLSVDGWPATGRIVPLPMYGLTQGELEQSPAAASALDRLFGQDDPPTATLPDAPDLVDYVGLAVRGGFPDAVGLSVLARAAWYEGYVEQLVHHDVNELDTVRSPAAMAALVRAVALNTAGLPSISALAEFSHLDQRTVKSYLDLLEELRMVERLPAWGVNRLGRLVKTPKYHVVDAGMAAHLAGDDQAGLLRSGDRLGRIIDTFVMAQLRPWLRLRTPPVTAYHLRDSNGQHEVDLVLEAVSGQIVGVEVKAANTVTAHDARHLAWLRDRLGSTFVRGVVLHTGTTTFPLGPQLTAMPIAALWRG
ncbi:MAG: ATP-binding protein [Propionibacteriaceae bacterium]|jgi:predicted AAA+ superfamily ATPase|nr:ATP-binding protein [Propionibacteriaceae bacterium]